MNAIVSRFSDESIQKLPFVIFVVAFFYALFAMIILRELVIPIFFNSSIDGMLPGDPEYYNELVQQNLRRINEYGIVGFEFRPEGQPIVGVASIFYWLYPHYISIVLVNSVLHGVSVTALYQILVKWFSRKISIIAIAPVLISPFMMAWFSQINKESFALAGAMLFTLGMLNIFLSENKNATISIGGLILVISSILLFWIVRPYVNKILVPAVVFGSIISFAMNFRLNIRRSINCIFAGAFIVCFLILFNRGAVSDETIASFKDFRLSENMAANSDLPLHKKCLITIDEDNWRDHGLFPARINDYFKALMGQRCLVFSILETHDNQVTINTVIHQNILPSGTVEALYYLPSALYAGIFLPDIGMLIYNARATDRISPFLFVASLEAALFVLSALGYFIYLFRGRQWSTLFPILTSIYVIWVYSVATPIIGALYRYRFPWWSVILCIFVASLLSLYLNVKNTQLNR